jgi:hypothetical protein
MKKLLLLAGLLLALLPAAASAAPDAPVLAKYYAWFDENTWGNGTLTDQPAQTYRSADRGAIERQVDQAKGAGIDGFELNWWGPDNPTDNNLATLLDVAGAKGFKVTVDVDLNSPFLTSRGDVANALSYLKKYHGHPAWFRVDGRPVVSFYGIRKYGVGDWANIRAASGNGDALWIGEGDQFGYLQAFDGIHPYSVAWSPNPSAQLASYASRTRAYPGKHWVATVMPGYNDTRLGRSNGFAVDRRGGDYYRNLWNGAIATKPTFIVITSWNEWPEGSHIEPSKGYGDLYLAITREKAAEFAGQHVAPPPSSLPTSAAGRSLAPGAAGAGCRFQLGFAALRGAIPGVVGGCVEDEHHNPENGDALQKTTGGLLVWRKSDNFTAFTDGHRSWVAGPFGVQSRLNSERFAWER